MTHLTLIPSRRSTKGTVYHVVADHSFLLLESRLPFYEGARELLKMGYPEGEVLTASHGDSPTIAMRSTIGGAAKWTIEETAARGMRRIRWAPMPKNLFTR
jgi:hypothetical protein